MSDAPPRNHTSVPLADVLADRWSPCALDPEHVVGRDDVVALLEAARWAPSADNAQPRRFVAARRGTRTFVTICGALSATNRAWAHRASLLVVAAAETSRDGQSLRFAEYDLGQSVAHLTVEAGYRGLYVRQMAGFDRQALGEAFMLPAGLVPLTVVAVGRHGDPDTLPEDIRGRETGPRVRRDLDEVALLLDL